MGLANALAMSDAKVTMATRSESGGTIVRDASGAPTGIFKDNAQGIIGDAIPGASAEMDDRAFAAAMKYLAEQGVTSVQHMGTWRNLAVFERAHKAGRMITRVSAAVPLSSWAQLRDTIAARGRGDDWLQIGGLKGFADGSLGSHTAAFLEPYTDVPGDTGLLVTPTDSLYVWALAADSAGLQVIVHAIGDRAIRNQLDIYERIKFVDGARDRRFRVEHAQHIAPSDIARFGMLHVIASMQPYHAIDDGRWAETVIGHKRAKTSYAWKSLLESGALLAFGSDWDVAPPTPIDGIYAAATRRTLDGKNPNGWIPEQKIGVEDALRAYTSGGAYAMFAEKSRGTLEAGKLADLAVIDRDLTKIPPEEVRNAHVVMTVVGGQVVYRRPTGGQ
jgi:predicted amidohydrolase YtcJ